MNAPAPNVSAVSVVSAPDTPDTHAVRDDEPALALPRHSGTETQANLGAVNISPYTRAGISLESHRGRLRVVITTEDRPDAPSDARASVARRVLCLRGDRLPHLIARLQAAHDTAVRLGMKKGGTTR